ncbi:alpha/beta hydrolase [Paraburkholderia rhizosphaerae]|uniref:Enterochelin esterase-like enzyme n=1 Tax=Paraburkholderia rhizosphaerae TaxID=480658 RepID=A0A4R8LLE0_9BURK|nr:alpha/beta hydrolase-fold protein [Paraburkholderia rhizosphaerae]TDY45354.1 enterochelin esterase-like enzyme [Paraburkholderia rhizosphaerae]
MRRLFRPLADLLCCAVALAVPAHAAFAASSETTAGGTPSLTLASPAAQPSTVESRSFHSNVLQRDWSYVVYLPPGYHAHGRRYPVLYLLHGNNDDAMHWVTQGRLQTTADSLIAHKDIPPVVIVMPQGGTDWYVDRKEKIETAFFTELLPAIEAHYAVFADRKNRVIGGASMGGFGALRYAMLRPEQFCGVLLLSPAIYSTEPPPQSAARHVGVFGEHGFDPEVWHALNYPALWQHYVSQPYRLPMFIGAGDYELVIQAEASTLYKRWREAGNPAALRIIGGGHNWDLWAVLLPAALKYALACTQPA